MRVSLSWLSDYITIEMPVDRLVDALTMVGLEVDSVSDRYTYLDRVLVGRIRDVRPHPNSDVLKFCEVDIGSGTIGVVCGAPNARKGLAVAVALPGAEFPDGTVLQKSVIRGPFTMWPVPPWFVGNPTAHVTARRLAAFEARPALWRIAGIAAAAAAGR